MALNREQVKSAYEAKRKQAAALKKSGVPSREEAKRSWDERVAARRAESMAEKRRAEALAPIKHETYLPDEYKGYLDSAVAFRDDGSAGRAELDSLALYMDDGQRAAWTNLNETWGEDAARSYIEKVADELRTNRDLAERAADRETTTAQNQRIKEFMTDEESAIYDYLLYNEGVEAATEFHSAMKETLRQRKNKEQEHQLAIDSEGYYSRHKEGFWGNTGLNLESIGYQALSGFEGIGNALAGILGAEVDENPYFTTRAQAMRDTVSEDMNGFGRFLYQTGMSMADSAVSTGVGMLLAPLGPGAVQGVSLALMGSQAASAAITEAKKKGYSDTEAAWLGIIAGGIEAGTEKIGLDALFDNTIFKNAGKNFFTKAAKYVGKNTLADGFEEFAAEAGNVLAEGAFGAATGNYDKTDFAKRVLAYMENGVIAPPVALGRAVFDVLGDSLLAGLGGMISGLGFGGVGSVVNTAVQAYKDTKDGRAIINRDNAKGLLLDAANASEKAELMKLAGKAKNAKAGSGKEARLTGRTARGVAEEAKALAESTLTIDEVRRLGGESAVAEYYSNPSKFEQALAALAYQKDEAAETESSRNSLARDALENGAVMPAEKKYIGKVLNAYNEGLKTYDGLASAKEIALEHAKARGISTEGREFFAILAELPEDVQAEINKMNEMGYRLAFETVHRMGTRSGGKPLGQMMKSLTVSEQKELLALSDATLAAAFSAGVEQTRAAEARQAEIDRKIAKEREKSGDSANKSSERRKKDKNKKKNPSNFTLEDSVNEASLTLTQREDIKLIRRLSECIPGIRFVITNKGVDADGNYNALDNGYYSDGEKTVYIDISAGRKTVESAVDFAIAFAGVHEVAHAIKANAPALWEELKSYVIDTYYPGKSLDYVVKMRMEEYQKQENKRAAAADEKPREITYDYALEEVIANSLERMLRSERVMFKLAKGHRRLFARIWRYIRDFFNRVIRKIGQYSHRTVESTMVERANKSQRKLEDLFVKALRAASDGAAATRNESASSQTTENNKKTAVTNTNEESVSVRQSLKSDDIMISDVKVRKITADMSDEERAEILSNKNVVAPVYEGQADEAIAANKGKIESGQKTLLKEAITTIAKEFGVIKQDINFNDAEVVITLSNRNLRESLTKVEDVTQLAKLIPILKSVAKNAIGIERHDNRYLFDRDTIYFENILGAYIDNEELVPVRFGLKHGKNGNTVLYIVVDQNKIPLSSLTEIKKTEVVKNPALQKQTPEFSHSVTYSISQIIEFVNSGDLLRYIPDEMLAEEQKTTKYKAIAKTIEKTNKKNDDRYFEYIKDGNLWEAKQMVIAAAKANGYTIHAYHGSNAEFNVFEPSEEGALGKGVYFSESREYAQGVAPDGKLYDVFLKITNPFEVKYPGEISQKSLVAEGYDGVHHEGNGFWVAFNPSQIKSAETITYDENGNIIPISKRFDSENTDIRFSHKGAEGREALIEAFSTLAKTDSEKLVIDKYRRELSNIEEKIRERSELQDKLEELKGKSGKAQERTELNARILSLTDYITRHDGKLLELRELAPFRDVMTRYADLSFQRGVDRKEREVRMSRGSYQKAIAEYTHARVYTKRDAERALEKITDFKSVKGKLRDDVINELWEKVNAIESPSDERDIAIFVREKIEDAIEAETKIENPDYAPAQERLSYFKNYVGHLSFSDDIKEAIRNKYDVDGSKAFFGRWGNKRPGVTPISADVFVTDFARENPGYEYLEEMSVSDALFEINDIYERARNVPSEISAYENASDDEIRALRREIGEVLDNLMQKGGRKSKAAENGELARSLYFKDEMNNIIAMNRAKVRLDQIAQKLRDRKYGRFENISEIKGTALSSLLRDLAAFNWRGTLSMNNIREKVGKLLDWYAKDNPVLEYRDEQNTGFYRADVREQLEVLADGEHPMRAHEYEMLYNVLSYFDNFVDSYDKVWKNGKWIDAKEESQRFIKIIDDNRRFKVGAVEAMIKNRYYEMFGDPETLVRAMDYYEDGFYTTMLEYLRRTSIDAQMAELNMLEEYNEFLRENPNYLKRAAAETVNYRGHEIPRLELISLFMTLKRSHSHAGFVLSGFKYTALDGKTSVRVSPMSTDIDLGQSEIEMIAVEEREKIAAKLTAEDRQYVAILEEVYNNRAREVKRQRDMQRLGYSNVTDDYYYPIRRSDGAHSVDTNEMQAELDRVSSASFNKDTVKGARHKLYIESADSLFRRHVRVVCQYGYIQEAIDYYDKVYHVTVNDNKNDPRSIATESENLWREGHEYFAAMISYIQGVVPKSKDGMALLNKVRSGYAKFQLGANPKVWLTQLSSIIASCNMLDIGSLVKAVAIKSDDVDKYCALARLRNEDNAAYMAQGVFDRTTAAGKAEGAITRAGDVLMVPIGKMDRAVVRHLFAACQSQVAKDGGAPVGTEANKVAAGELLERVILRTQQNSLGTEKSRAMRSTNELLRALTMFSADSMKLFGRFLDSIGEYRTMRAKAAHSTGEARERYVSRMKAAGRKIKKAVAATVGTAVFMLLLGIFFKHIRAKDDEITPEAVIVDGFGNLLGGLPLIRDIYSVIFNGYELENFSYSAFNDIFQSVRSLSSNVAKLVTGERDVGDLMRSLKSLLYAAGQVTGIPVRNVYNYIHDLIKRFFPDAAEAIDEFFGY